jgi:hypothetical protein
LLPLKLKASLTSPRAKLAPFSSVPLLLPMWSVASPSPFHQETRPVGCAKQALAGVTVVEQEAAGPHTVLRSSR